MRTKFFSLIAGLLTLGIALVVCNPSPLAQITAPWQPFVRSGAFSSGSSYVGPCDAISCSGIATFTSLRCITAAYAGNVADVWDAATGNTTETKITCSSGTLVTSSPSPLATTCASGCVALARYDQSGANACSSAPCDETVTLANAPTFLQNCPTTGLFCLSFNGTTQSIVSPPISPVATIPTHSVVAERTGNFTTYGPIIGSDNGGFPGLSTAFGTVANSISLGQPGTNITGVADNVVHSIQVQYNGTGSASAYKIDNGSNTAANASSSSQDRFRVGIAYDSGFGTQYLLTGKVMETILFSGIISSRWAALNANQSVYWCGGSC